MKAFAVHDLVFVLDRSWNTFGFVKPILKALLVNMYNGYSDGVFTVIAHTYAKIAKVTLIP